MRSLSSTSRGIMSKVDQFGEDVGFTINGERRDPSMLGSLVSLVVLCLTLAYAQNKLNQLHDYDSTTFQKQVMVGENKHVEFKYSELGID